MRELFRCDLCRQPATTIHLIPAPGIECEEALFACASHDPGGYYWFPVTDWIDHRAKWLRHLADKSDKSPRRRPGDTRIGGLDLLLSREAELLRPVVQPLEGDDTAQEEAVS